MTFAFVDFFWLCTLIAIMIFRCCAVLKFNAFKQFSDVVVFQSQLKAAELYLLFLSFFFFFKLKLPSSSTFVLFIILHKVKC